MLVPIAFGVILASFALIAILVLALRAPRARQEIKAGRCEDPRVKDGDVL